MTEHEFSTRVLMVTTFAIAMAFVEAAVVVYLRELFYPDGFSLPLRDLPTRLLTIELLREAATVLMLSSVAFIAGRRPWERFGYFLIMFGLWDIFYYVWLRATLGWPSSLFDWDILFLVPLPWIGPVIAPMLVALGMVVVGIWITMRYARGLSFRPTRLSWILAVAGSLVILYSFMRDTAATIDLQLPQPYPYWLLGIGLALYLWAWYAVWHVLEPMPLARRAD